MTVVNAGYEEIIARVGARGLLATLMEAFGDRIVITGPDERVCHWGAAVAARLRYSADDAMGHTPGELFAEIRQLRQYLTVPPDRTSFMRLPLTLPGGATEEISYVRHGIPDEQGHPMASLYVLCEDGAPSTPIIPEGGDLIDRLIPNAKQLEELNHQVRNNLAIVCALLEMEILQTPEAERHRLRVSLARIRTLTLIYNLLLTESTHRVEIGTLTRAVLDSVMSFYGHIAGGVPVLSSVTPIHISPRRGTYLGLVLTELAVHMIGCSFGHCRLPCISVAITPDAGEVTLTVTATACARVTEAGCAPRQICAPLDGLSRDILVGLVERSLGGQVTLDDAPTFRATITCPLEG